MVEQDNDLKALRVQRPRRSAGAPDPSAASAKEAIVMPATNRASIEERGEDVRPFVYEALPGRVVFGAGASREKLAGEVDRLGAERILLVATEQERPLAEELAGPLGERVVGVFTGVRPHVPVEVADAARGSARRLKADCLLSVGGGSTTGTAKAVALDTKLPIVAVSTTYSRAAPRRRGRRTTGEAPPRHRAEKLRVQRPRRRARPALPLGGRGPRRHPRAYKRTRHRAPLPPHHLARRAAPPLLGGPRGK